MKTKISSLSYNPLFVITTSTVLVATTYLNKGLGLISGLTIVLTAMWASNFSDIQYIAKRAAYSNLILDILFVLVGAIGISLTVSLGFVSLGYAGLIDTPILGIPRVGVHLLTTIVSAALIAFSIELILRGYFQKRLSYIFGDNKFSWLIASLIISLLFGISLSSYGYLTAITAALISLYFSKLYITRRNQLINLLTAHALFGIWMIFQSYLFQDVLFHLVYLAE